VVTWAPCGVLAEIRGNRGGPWSTGGARGQPEGPRRNKGDCAVQEETPGQPEGPRGNRRRPVVNRRGPVVHDTDRGSRRRPVLNGGEQWSPQSF
jgi:hypothetical protein